MLDELGNTLRRRILTRFADVLTPKNLPQSTPLDELITIVGAELRKDDPLEPHRVLAALPIKVFVTTNVNSLMADALKDVSRQPVVELLPWNDELLADYKDSSIFVQEPGYRPSAERPLVYHLFGRLSRPESIVLTEDDHFEFLKGAARNSELIPNFVQRAMADFGLALSGLPA